jgi:hypothetical protein
VHKFDFRLVIKETTENGDQWKEGDSDSYVWQDLCVIHLPLSRVLRDCTHAVRVNYILLCEGR